MHFDQVSRSPPFKVWSGHLPKQFGGVEATWVDQSTTKLGRGVQFLSSPTSSKIPRNHSLTTVALPTTDWSALWPSMRCRTGRHSHALALQLLHQGLCLCAKSHTKTKHKNTHELTHTHTHTHDLSLSHANNTHAYCPHTMIQQVH